MEQIKTEQDLRKYIEELISDQEYEISGDTSVLVSTYHENVEKVKTHLSKIKSNFLIRVLGSGSIDPQKLIYYFNDEQQNVTVVTGTLEGPRSVISSATGSWFRVFAKRYESIYIKRWSTGLILISSTKDLSRNLKE